MTVEIRIENVGELPVNVPVSPHLSDLQPKDPPADFRIFEIILPLMYAGKSGSANFSNVILFGSPETSGTTREIRHGEWITVRAAVHPILTHADGMQIEPVYDRLTPVSSTWEYFKMTFRPAAGGFSTEQCQLAFGRNPGETKMVRWIKREH